MATTGLLEQLYFGLSPRADRLPRPSSDAAKEGRVEQLLRGYRELVKGFPPSTLERLGAPPPELWRGMRELGLFGMLIDEEYGGLGLSLTQYLRVVEQISMEDSALALIPLAHLSIGLKGILLFGSEEQKRRYLPRAASGEMIFAYALTEPHIGSDAQHIESRAVLSEDGSCYLLNGQKTYITNANYAGALTVFAQLDPLQPGYMGAFVVETGWEGVKIGKDMPKMGLSVSSTAAIQLKDVRVPIGNLLGTPGEGFKIAMSILNYGRLGLAAGASGGMKRAVADMTDRARARKQFGRPVADFELIQEKIARARAHGFAAAAMTSVAARSLESDPVANVAIESSHAKLFGTERAWQAVYDALQVAGGAGYLSTQPYEKRMRDARVTTVFEGTSEIHSIYPPTLAARELGKALKGRSALRRLLFLLRYRLARPRLPLSAGRERTTAEALRLASRAVRGFRGLLARALLRYGSSIVEHEFLMRRLTNLSLAAFTLVASLEEIGREREEGGPEVRAGSSRDEEALRVLRYLAAEARATIRLNRRLADTEVERLVPSLAPASGSAEGNRVPQPSR